MTIGGGVTGSRGYKQSKVTFKTNPATNGIPSLSSADEAHRAGVWRQLENDDSALHWGRKGSGFIASKIIDTDWERTDPLEMKPIKGDSLTGPGQQNH